MAWVVESPSLENTVSASCLSSVSTRARIIPDLVIWNLPRPQSESQMGHIGSRTYGCPPRRTKTSLPEPVSPRVATCLSSAPAGTGCPALRPGPPYQAAPGPVSLASSFFCCDSGSSGPGLGRLEGSRLTNPRAFPAFTASLRVARSTFGRGLGTIVSGSSMPSPKPYFPLMTTPLSREPGSGIGHSPEFT